MRRRGASILRRRAFSILGHPWGRGVSSAEAPRESRAREMRAKPSARGVERKRPALKKAAPGGGREAGRGGEGGSWKLLGSVGGSDSGAERRVRGRRGRGARRALLSPPPPPPPGRRRSLDGYAWCRAAGSQAGRGRASEWQASLLRPRRTLPKPGSPAHTPHGGPPALRGPLQTSRSFASAILELTCPPPRLRRQRGDCWPPGSFLLVQAGGLLHPWAATRLFFFSPSSS